MSSLQLSAEEGAFLEQNKTQGIADFEAASSGESLTERFGEGEGGKEGRGWLWGRRERAKEGVSERERSWAKMLTVTEREREMDR